MVETRRVPRSCEDCGHVATRQRRVRLEQGCSLCQACRRVRNRAATPPPEITCNFCGETKPSTEFYRHARDGFITRKCRACHLARRRLDKYGVTPEEVERLTVEQAGRCAICALERKLYVDHCHTGGAVRGLLCRECNSGLGMFGDDAERLLAAAAYLIASEEVSTRG